MDVFRPECIRSEGWQSSTSGADLQVPHFEESLRIFESLKNGLPVSSADAI